MRIAYVCADPGIPYLGFKGGSVHMREMAHALSAHGNDVSVVCARLGDGNPPPDVQRTLILPGDEVMRDPFLVDLFREESVDTVLERYSLDSGSARAASTQLRIPLVLELNAPLALEAARYRGLTDVEVALEREREALESADAVVVVSPALEDYVRGRAAHQRVVRVPNGVDIAAFSQATPHSLGLPRGSIAVGFVGSMKPWHGVQDLLDAFALVAEASPAAQLVLVGTGPGDEMIRAAGESLPLRGRIHALGPVAHRDVAGILASLSVAVAPYPPTPDFYFSPLKVMEYMAAGVPVVFSDVGDLSHVVGPAGISFPPGDVPALARALQRVIGDAGLRYRLSAAGRARSRDFTWDAAAARVESVLREVILVSANEGPR